MAVTAEEAIHRSEVIIIMLWDFKSIKETLSLETEKASQLKGKIVVQMSTIAPDENLVCEKRETENS